MSKSGVKIHYYPNNYKNLQKLVNNKTKLIYVESPGSLNFNVEDLKFITKFAKKINLFLLLITPGLLFGIIHLIMDST